MAEFIDLLGKLPGESSCFWQLEKGKYTVFLNNHNQIQMMFESLVPLEQAFNQEKFFSAYVDNFVAYGIDEGYEKNSFSRTEDLKDLLEDYFIVFQPIDTGNYVRMENVALTIKPSFYEEGMTFTSIPFFKTKQNLNQFLQQIQQKGGLRWTSGIESCRHLPYLLWQQEGQPFIYAIGNKSGFRYWQGKMQMGAESLECYQLDEFETKRIILNPRQEDEGIAFVEDNMHVQLGQYVAEKRVYTPVFIPEHVTEGEEQFLNHLKALIVNSRFTYKMQDIVNFHTAMKSGGFVILEGMSGTGKSRLVDFYRQALGLKKEQYKFVSVRSSWTDESDLLGYPDMMNQLYRPDHEGVVDLLIHAYKHPDQLHLLCLDEMNLARVEHYLSQFLSVLEMQQGEQWISLYNEEIDLKNKDQYPARIPLNGNLLFVGTINRDESTHHFSDKVLDRANVIQLNVESLKQLYEMMLTPVALKTEHTSLCLSYKDYQKMSTKGAGMCLTAEEVEVLEALHVLLSSVDGQKGIGYRVLKQIDEYMGNLPTCQQVLSRQEAFDLQIKQRILSKLRGDRSSFEGILIGHDTLLECLKSYNEVSSFEASIKVIEQKMKELNRYGYTM